MIALIDRLLEQAAEMQASDLHLIAGVPPTFRVNGEILIANHDVLRESELSELRDVLLNDLQRSAFASQWEICVSLHHPAVGRMRVTLYRRNGSPEFSVRLCGRQIHTREELGLPPKIDDLVRRRNGLILVTGPTGSGKTTTLNYLVDLINRERRCKILTIEDPIEYVHENNLAIIVQQEVLTDTHSFDRALTHALRQDPDVIVVGEIRDHAAIATALNAAETGHLVLATMHSPSTVQAIDRIVGTFDGNSQRQVVIQLANSLQGILTQELLPSLDGGRSLACELLMANSAVRRCIRDGQLQQLDNMIQTGSREGMVLMDASLGDLYAKCRITYDTAMSRARHPEHFSQRFKT
jgi:twitching motility protein PilT